MWSLADIYSVNDSFGLGLDVGLGFTAPGQPTVLVGAISYGQPEDPSELIYETPGKDAIDLGAPTAYLSLGQQFPDVDTGSRFLGDLDGDGGSELLSNGTIFFSPRLGSLTAGAGDLKFIGSSPSIGSVAVGDFDADGLDDLAGWVTGSYPDPNRLCAFEKLSAGVRDVSAPDLVWTDTDAGDVYGSPFKRAEDVAAGGYAYLSVQDASGNAQLLEPVPFATAGAWATFAPRYPDEQSAGAFGDFDGDGQQDWLVTIGRGANSPLRVALLPGPIPAGAYTEDDAHSVTLLLDGPPGGPDIIGDFDVGDFDGDGLDDAVIGNPTSAAGGEGAGAVLVLPGAALL